MKGKSVEKVVLEYDCLRRMIEELAVEKERLAAENDRLRRGIQALDDRRKQANANRRWNPVRVSPRNLTDVVDLLDLLSNRFSGRLSADCTLAAEIVKHASVAGLLEKL